MVNPRHHSRANSHGSNESNTSNGSNGGGPPTTVSDSTCESQPVRNTSSRRARSPSFAEQKRERKAEREQKEKAETEAKARRANEAYENASKVQGARCLSVLMLEIQDHLRHNYGDLPMNQSHSTLRNT